MAHRAKAQDYHISSAALGRAPLRARELQRKTVHLHKLLIYEGMGDAAGAERPKDLVARSR